LLVKRGAKTLLFDGPKTRHFFQIYFDIAMRIDQTWGTDLVEGSDVGHPPDQSRFIDLLAGPT